MKKEIDIYIPKYTYGWIKDEKYENTTCGIKLPDKNRIVDLKGGKYPMYLYNAITKEVRIVK